MGVVLVPDDYHLDADDNDNDYTLPVHTMAADSSERTTISGMLSLHSAMSASLLRGVVSVEGLVLHVEEYGEQPSETLTYRKSQSRIVAIGRKSSQGNPEQPDPERALFRCPVVSRKHAKITFTEYGNVCQSLFLPLPGLMNAEHLSPHLSILPN